MLILRQISLFSSTLRFDNLSSCLIKIRWYAHAISDVAALHRKKQARPNDHLESLDEKWTEVS